MLQIYEFLESLAADKDLCLALFVASLGAAGITVTLAGLLNVLICFFPFYP